MILVSVSQGEDDVEQEPGAPPATRLSVKYQIVPSSAGVGQTVIPPVLYNLFLWCDHTPFYEASYI